MLIDVIFAILAFFAIIKGIKKGLILALFSVVAFIIGLAAALKLSAVVAHKLSQSTAIDGKWLPFLSFMLVFIAVVLLVNKGGKLLEKTAEMVMLGWANKLAGACLYLILYGLLYSVFLFYAVQLHFVKTETINASVIYPYIYPLAPKVINGLGSVIPFFKDMFIQLEQFFEGVSSKLQH